MLHQNASRGERGKQKHRAKIESTWLFGDDQGL
jgi:hypothetical protein